MLIFLWQTGGTPPPPPPVIEIDTHDGVDREAQRNREFREGRSSLRQSVERAYRRAVYGEEILPVAAVAAPLPVKALAKIILPEVRAADMRASLAEIEALVAELEAHRAQARTAADEEALLVLMLS